MADNRSIVGGGSVGVLSGAALASGGDLVDAPNRTGVA